MAKDDDDADILVDLIVLVSTGDPILSRVDSGTNFFSRRSHERTMMAYRDPDEEVMPQFDIKHFIPLLQNICVCQRVEPT